jgi:hypothetical protein
MPYRYYVSHALLQNRKAEAGSIARVHAIPGRLLNFLTVFSNV